MKRVLSAIVGTLVVAGLLGLWWWQRNYMFLNLAGNDYLLEISDSPAERYQGLSGRTEVPFDGMIFIFDETAKHAISMRGMEINIDIVWLDENFSIVDYKTNVSPATFPEEFTPEKPARYVVELEAGEVDKLL